MLWCLKRVLKLCWISFIGVPNLQVLRIWDTHLQVCQQRLSGMFPKGPVEGKIFDVMNDLRGYFCNEYKSTYIIYTNLKKIKVMAKIFIFIFLIKTNLILGLKIMDIHVVLMIASIFITHSCFQFSIVLLNWVTTVQFTTLTNNNQNFPLTKETLFHK